jgi:putative colanic acid biosysnthesis UDP-glucose lipid carrier transferase
VPVSSLSIRSHRSWRDVLQPALDACAVLASLATVVTARHETLDESVLVAGLLATIIFLVVGRAVGLHHQNDIDSVNQEVASVGMAWAITVLMLSLVVFAAQAGTLYSRTIIFAWVILTPALIGICRMATRIVRHGLMRKGIGTRRVAIAGLNDLGRQAEENLHGDSGLGWNFVGYYDDRQTVREDDQAKVRPLIGNLEQMVSDARSGKIDTVLITLPMRAEDRIRGLLERLRDSTTSVYVIPDFFVFEMLHSSLKSIGGLPAVSIFENPLASIGGVGKRITDLVLGMIGLLMFSLPMIVIAIAIKLTSSGPVFFRQRRYGLDGQEIYVWKFRSMTTCDNGMDMKQATKGDARITPLGAVLRKTSLDELPQLFNVIQGSMSLVGPRPHATAHNEFYRGQIRGYMLRHKIKPGITGLAQVNGCRGETDTLEKMQRRIDLDHEYIRFWSMWLDLRILLKTLLVAWRQPEAY